MGFDILFFFSFTDPDVWQTIKSCFSMFSKHPPQTFIHQSILRLLLSKDHLRASFLHAFWVRSILILILIEVANHSRLWTLHFRSRILLWCIYGGKNLVYTKGLSAWVYKKCCRRKEKLKRCGRGGLLLLLLLLLHQSHLLVRNHWPACFGGHKVCSLAKQRSSLCGSNTSSIIMRLACSDRN